MNAEIIAVGSELLTPQKTDTNSLYLTDQLNSLGVEVVGKMILGDDRARLAAAIAGALGRSEIVILTGGLGPTEDDVTRDAVALALGRTQQFSEEVFRTIEERFRRLKRAVAENNRRQAFVVEGAEVLPNSRGTAPGQWIVSNGRVLVLLPGPPKEMRGLWEEECLPRLQRLLPPQVIRTRFYRVAGMPESDLDQLIAPVYTRYENPACTILAALSDIQIHLRARCGTEEEAERLLEEVGSQIEPLLGDRLFSTKGEPLEACIGNLLRERDETVAVAESCTGGLLAGRITDVAGSSAYFKGGLLTYTDQVKAELLGVDEELLRRDGAVSESVATEMAIGARDRLGTTYALSVTGVAGPDGGSEATPVGCVFVGFASPEKVKVRRYQFLGDRSRIRAMAVQSALDLLRLEIVKCRTSQ